MRTETDTQALVERLRSWLASSSPERHEAIEAELPLALDALASQSAEISALRAKLAEAESEIARQRRRATDGEYMARAYRAMLGPTGLDVAAMWDAKGVKRTHVSWGPEAQKLTGEQRAKSILDWENAPRRSVLPGEIDAGSSRLVEESNNG